MSLFYVLCAVLCATTQAQFLPFNSPVSSLVSPCSPVISPCQAPLVAATPTVATTVVDNSVSNSLANALQLLIVSNLIENTVSSPCALAAVAPICDSIATVGYSSMYSSPLDIITSDCYSYNPYDPIVPVAISTCDYISPCDTIIDYMPNSYYPDVISYTSCGCDGPYGSNMYANNFAPCGCNSYASPCNAYPSPIISSPSCGCNSYPYGVPSIPLAVDYDCPSPYYSRGYYC